MGAKRFILEDSIADEFVNRFKAALAKFIPGDPTDPKTTLAPLCTERALKLVESQIDAATKGGATVLLGGKRINRKGYFLEPTILSNVTPENPVFHQEFFSPVAMIFRVKNDDEVAKLANDSPYGLGGSIITKDVERGKRIARQIHTGVVFINQACWTAGPALRRRQEFGLWPRAFRSRHRRVLEQEAHPGSVTEQVHSQPSALAATTRSN